MRRPRVAVELVEVISEDEMIAAFVRAEVDSPRQGEKLRVAAEALGLDLDVVREPDCASQEENTSRRRLLEEYRGWGRYESLFGGLPTETVTWWSAILHRAGIDEIEVIQWLVDEYPAGFPARQLAEIREKRVGPARGRPENAVEMARALQGSRPPPPPILIAEPSLDRLVILEGHNRMVAYAFLADAAPEVLDVIVGVTPDAEAWSEW